MKTRTEDSMSSSRRPSARAWLTLAGAFGLAASVGCGDESRPSDASFGSTNGQQLCAAIEQAAGSCGAPSSCEQALVQDCSALVGLLAEPYVEAMIDCIDGGTDPLGCLAGGLAERVQPNAEGLQRPRPRGTRRGGEPSIGESRRGP